MKAKAKGKMPVPVIAEDEDDNMDVEVGTIVGPSRAKPCRYHHLVIPCYTVSKENARENNQGRSRRRKERQSQCRSLKKWKERPTNNVVI